MLSSWESSERFSPCGGLKFRLGFDSASDSYVEPTGRFGLRPENLEHPGETTQPYLSKNRPSVPNRSHLKRVNKTSISIFLTRTNKRFLGWSCVSTVSDSRVELRQAVPGCPQKIENCPGFESCGAPSIVIGIAHAGSDRGGCGDVRGLEPCVFPAKQPSALCYRRSYRCGNFPTSILCSQSSSLRILIFAL